MSQLNRHLRSDERVLWTGKPVKVPFVVPSLMSIPFGLMFLGFSIFWMMMASQAPFPFQLFGVPFVLMGFGVTFGPSIGQLMRYSNTEYMITNQRIIIQTGAIGLDTRFVDLNRVQEVNVVVGFFDRMFGTGTVIAATAGTGAFMRSLASLREPYEVQRLLQEAIKNFRTSESTL